MRRPISFRSRTYWGRDSFLLKYAIVARSPWPLGRTPERSPQGKPAVDEAAAKVGEGAARGGKDAATASFAAAVFAAAVFTAAVFAAVLPTAAGKATTAAGMPGMAIQVQVIAAAFSSAAAVPSAKFTRGEVQPLPSRATNCAIPGTLNPAGTVAGSTRYTWRPGRRFWNEKRPSASVVAISPSSVHTSIPATPASAPSCWPL
jgi:hypothetical protein